MAHKTMRGTVVSLICPKHGFVRGDHCPMCAEEKREGPVVHIFKPMVYHDICETPLLIESKKQLRDECRKHNVIAARLL